MRLPTPRLVLRTAAAADVPALVAYALGEARESARFSPRRPPSHFTAAHWRGRVRAQEEARRADRGLVLYLFRKGAPREVVGHASLSNVVRGTFQAAHLGYALREAHRGRGLMTEALRAVLRHAFGPMGLHRVMANYMPSNAPSARVLRRLGFRREGLARDYLLIDGRWRDHVLTSLVHPRWRPDPRDRAAAAAAGR
jgi:ribosomal-protein-alanine N-acetyltransferase